MTVLSPARKHGVQARRQGRKVRLAMDTTTSGIRAVAFTPSRDDDSPVLPELPDQIPEGEQTGAVTAPPGDASVACPAMDGAYDTRTCRTSNIEHRTSNIEHRTSNIEHRTSNIEHQTTAIIPVRKNERCQRRTNTAHSPGQ
jgi:hypothetical protein